MANLEPVPNTPFDVRKLTGVSNEVFLTLARLSGLTKGLKYPECQLTQQEYRLLYKSKKNVNQDPEAGEFFYLLKYNKKLDNFF